MYDSTAEEIIEQTDGNIQHMVMSAGTGGTMTGISKKLKEKIPGITIVGVDPRGSILAKPDSLNDQNRLQAYQVEGIGYDFIPTVCDQDIADVWIKSEDEASFKYARALIRHEGLMCGGSCGSALSGAVEHIRKNNIGKGQRVVVLLPDSTRNYMSKFLADEWMNEHGFSTEEL